MSNIKSRTDNTDVDGDFEKLFLKTDVYVFSSLRTNNISEAFYTVW